MHTNIRGHWLDWQHARGAIAATLASVGYYSLTEYATNYPGMTLAALARQLDVSGLHGGHLRLRLWEEAAERGDLVQCARDLLVRLLCEAHRAAKESDEPWTRYLEHVFQHWSAQLPQNYRHVVDPIQSAVTSVEPPTDWHPVSDDPLLASLFARHWPPDRPGHRYRVLRDRSGHITIEVAGQCDRNT